ncbi:MAG: GGDEF domain-containing protein [Halieaceae bacterium]|uniref:GGDEF domain-containing protein n=1 Tax=Haliea alexandrii TaxID=2448162 RepID=UPI001304BB3E|nr:GGDEF domain-containing protein [Haliea alexandrii]MCR9185911.1 GGDEF domain-containing protein [Halieaceae bacterium]
MNSLSIPTLFLVIGMVSAMCTLITFMLWRINRDMAGVFPWFLAALANTAGFFAAFPLAGRGGVEQYLTVFNNSLALIGAALLLEGALQFRGHLSLRRWRFGLLLIPLFIAVAWVFRLDPVARHLAHDVLSAPLMLAVALVMVWRTRGPAFRVYGLAALFPALVGLVLLYRGWWALRVTLDPSLSIDAPRAIAFLVVMLCLMGWTFGITVACYFRAHLSTLQLAIEDVLTGLPNRRNIDETLRRTLRRAKRHAEHFAVLLVDLNDFKQVNDRFGHQAGDELLVEVARRLRGFLREADFAGRLGGDEFFVIVHGVGDGVSARRARERLRAALDGPLEVCGETVAVRVAVGVALWPAQGESADALMRAADADMYVDKTGHS